MRKPASLPLAIAAILVLAACVQLTGPAYKLFILLTPSDGGTVTRSPEKTLYDADTTVTLSAAPATGYAFIGWSGDATGSDATVSVAMDSDKAVLAGFEALEDGACALTVAVLPPAGGVVSRDPTGSIFAIGATVSLTATPATGYAFIGWSGDATDTASTIVLTMDQSKTVMASFSPLPSYEIAPLAYPPAGGGVALSPAGPYAAGTDVKVTALPVSGYSFSGWTGALGGFSNPAVLAMDGDKTLMATFEVFKGSGFVIGKPLSLAGSITSLSGTGTAGYLEGTGATAQFDAPEGIVIEGASLYVADGGNRRIRRVDQSTGATTFIAGSGAIGAADGTGAAASFTAPKGLAFDGRYLYTCDANCVRRIDPGTGAVTTFAGLSGTAGSVDGVGTSARFNAPFGIVSDGDYLYVTDSGNHTIRRILIAQDAGSRLVTTLAGTAGATGSADGVGAAARFSSPAGITTDGAYLYIADRANQLVRRLEIATAAVTSLAGAAGQVGGANGTGTGARFSEPTHLTTEGKFLYLTEAGGHTIRVIELATGAVTTLAGTYATPGFQDGTGAVARLNAPAGIAAGSGGLFLCDRDNHRIRAAN